MKRSAAAPHRFRVSLVASVRARLTLWYMGAFAGVMLLFGGSLYASQVWLNSGAAESRMQTQLYQDSGTFENSYRQALQRGESPGEQRLSMSSNEIVLLLSPDGSVLDKRGPLPDNLVQQLWTRSESSSQLDISIAQPKSSSSQWWHEEGSNYHVLVTPVLNQNARIAVLMVGLERGYTMPLLTIWLFHGLGVLLIAAFGGYWLAGKALRPVKMITRTANEINATDLRRRLHFKRRDEFGELAATFDQMLDRLEAAFKRQAQFTADASHELRTPLTIIDLEINRALTQLQRPEEYRQVLELLQSENEQMAAIVNSLLLLARADTGKMTLEKQEVDLGDLVLASVERLLPLARQSQVTLATGDLPELLVSGDPQYLCRMLTNLIENAIKYTSGVGKRVHVELAREGERRGVVRVRDDGPGIAEEHLPYLFDRFYRVDRARTRQERLEGGDKPGGSGLGLAIVQWIVQAHGGEVYVESRVGAGSLFAVYLPLSQAGKSNMTD